MINDKDQKENIKTPERVVPTQEQPSFKQEKAKNPETPENHKSNEVVEAELRREIETMELDPATKKEAEVEREKIGYLGEKEKIQHLLETARKRGLVFAIQVARKMNDPFILDNLHDALAKEGFYKDFTK